MSSAQSDHPVEVLIVEDNPGDVLLTKKTLDKAGIASKTHVVHDGAEALDFLHKRANYESAPTPHLVLLDINLPKMNGPEVLEAIKNSPELRHIPVVMLTGSDREEDIANAYEKRASSFITKPPTQLQLVEVVRGLDDYWYSIAMRAHER